VKTSKEIKVVMVIISKVPLVNKEVEVPQVKVVKKVKKVLRVSKV